MLGLSRAFSIPCPRQLLHPELFIAWRIGKKLWTRLYWVIEVKPLLAVGSSSFVSSEESTLCLVCSRASTFQPPIVFGTNPLSGCPGAAQVLCSPLARHGRVHLHFQLSPRILDNFFVLYVFPTNESRCLSVFEHCSVSVSRFSVLSRFWAALRTFVRTSGHT